MDKKINFSVKMLKKERFTCMEHALDEEEEQVFVNNLQKKYGGQIKMCRSVVYIYIPILTRDGEQCHRLKLLKDALKSFLNVIFGCFSNK